MSFNPERWPQASRAMAAALIASARGSGIVEKSDWDEALGRQAAKITEQQRATIGEMSVADEVVREVAEHFPSSSLRVSRTRNAPGHE